MARPDKVAIVEEIQQKLDGSDAAVLTEYRGLTVGELAELRSALRPAATEYKVFKNSLARRAVEASGREELLDLLEGPVAFAFVQGDAAVAAKAIDDFAGDHKALVVKGGLLGDVFLEAVDVAALAKLEPRDVLLAKIAGAFQAPMTKAAGLFNAIPRQMAQLTQALVDKRVAAGEEPPPVEEPPAEEPPAEEPPAEELPAEEPAAESAEEPAEASDENEAEENEAEKNDDDTESTED